MRRRGAFEFPMWCGRIAAALAIHGGLGWVLAGAGTPEAAPAQRAEARLFWLEPAVERDDGSESAAAERRASSEGAAGREGGAPAVSHSSVARGTSPRSPASEGHSDPRRPPLHHAAVVRAPATPLPDVQPSAAAERMTEAASANEVATARAAFEGTRARGTTSGLRAATLSAGDLSSKAGGSSRGGFGEGLGGAAGIGAGSLGGSPAHLLGATNRCADLFPYAATSDTGTVAVSLEVATSGQPVASRIVDEAPRGQGFAVAASHCIRRLRFSPAVDYSGRAVASRSVVRLRFQRGGASARVAL